MGLGMNASSFFSPFSFFMALGVEGNNKVLFVKEFTRALILSASPR